MIGMYLYTIITKEEIKIVYSRMMIICGLTRMGLILDIPEEIILSRPPIKKMKMKVNSIKFIIPLRA